MTDTNVIAAAPFYRRLWLVVVLTCSLLLMPLAMILLLTGNVYRKRPEGWQPISNKARYIYGGLLVVWLVAATAKVLLQPGGFKQEWANNAVHDNSQTQTAAAPPLPKAPKDDLDTCTSEDTIASVKSAIEDSATSKLVEVKVVDFGNARETWFQKGNFRRCVADAILNTGASLVTYQFFLGPSGKQIIQVQTGDEAATQLEIDKGQKANAEREALAALEAGMAAKRSPESNSGGQADQESDADVRAEYSDDYLNCMSGGAAAKGDSDAMIHCIKAEADFQNSRIKRQFQQKKADLPDADFQAYRDNELAWAQGMLNNCARLRNNGDPVAEPHCILNNTIRHFKSM